MKRFKYSQNSQVLATGNFQELTTVGIVPVVPGDTISGTSLIQTLSESSTKVINNRTYQDVFAFYVPYRLVFEDWPAFIAGDDTVSLPLETDSNASSKQFLTKEYAPTSSIGGFGQVNQLGRRSYNLIWNKFFRPEVSAERAEDATGVALTPLRSTTLNQRLKDSIELLDQTIDTSGATITTGDIRTAFAQDRFDKTRAYYGSKYTDYLAALGVEASWSILDEPELIGMSTNKLKYNITDATSEIAGVDTDPTGEPVYVGSAGGRWQGTQQLRVKKTFCPEHGCVFIMQTVRMDLELTNNKGIFEFFKLDRSRFYSPEFETERKEGWFPYADPVVETELFLEKYDDYRSPVNFTAGTTANQSPAFIEAPGVAAPTQEDILFPDPTNLKALLNDQYPGVELNLSCMHRISKISPVRPSQSVHGVS